MARRLLEEQWEPCGNRLGRLGDRSWKIWRDSGETLRCYEGDMEKTWVEIGRPEAISRRVRRVGGRETARHAACLECECVVRIVLAAHRESATIVRC